AILYDKPPRCGAALASGEIGGLNGEDRGRAYVPRVPDHQRVVSAELESEDLVRRFGELLVERLSNTRRAGEQKAVDSGLRGKRPALLRSADQQPNDSFGDFGFVKAANEELAGCRRLFRRLEHDRIAGDQRRDDVAVREVRRKVVGSEDSQDPVR